MIPLTDRVAPKTNAIPHAFEIPFHDAIAGRVSEVGIDLFETVHVGPNHRNREVSTTFQRINS